MPPVRKKRKVGKVSPFEFTVPGHRFLGPGTDLDKLRYAPPLNQLDKAAKKHDIAYGDKSISTEEADEQFIRDTQGTGILGAASRTAIRIKRHLGLDQYFRDGTGNVHPDTT